VDALHEKITQWSVLTDPDTFVEFEKSVGEAVNSLMVISDSSSSSLWIQSFTGTAIQKILVAYVSTAFRRTLESHFANPNQVEMTRTAIQASSALYRFCGQELMEKTMGEAFASSKILSEVTDEHLVLKRFADISARMYLQVQMMPSEETLSDEESDEFFDASENWSQESDETESLGGITNGEHSIEEDNEAKENNGFLEDFRESFSNIYIDMICPCPDADHSDLHPLSSLVAAMRVTNMSPNFLGLLDVKLEQAVGERKADLIDLVLKKIEDRESLEKVDAAVFDLFTVLESNDWTYQEAKDWVNVYLRAWTAENPESISKLRAICENHISAHGFISDGTRFFLGALRTFTEKPGQVAVDENEMP
jgi:hypothetical protein